MFAIIRIRGLKHVRADIQAALATLNLDRKNHCVIIQEKGMEGILTKVKDYVAYGNVKKETLTKLLQKRGHIEGDKALTLDYLKEKKISSFDALANDMSEKKTTLSKIGIKPVFRLNAPRKGFGRKGTKKPVTLKGPLGFHPEGMDALLASMM
ncbi:MAG: 50S ribosomal protein L30 [Candidatus Diapherotrites archaeon]